jgi:hypothetical protein
MSTQEVAMKTATRRTTLMDVVRVVQDQAESDAQVVELIAYMIDSGRVVLTGDRASRRIADTLAV